MSRSDSPRLRLAILGAGGISGAHARAMLALPDRIECTLLCDVSKENLHRRAEQLGGTPVHCTDWKQMLSKHGDQFDAVVIALPHHLHAAAILDCLAAGKHVLCEKPLCTSLIEADAIVSAVQAAGVTFMPGHNALFHPFVGRVKEMVGAGTIGRVLHMRSQDCFVLGADFSDTWRGRFGEQGGGELIDTGYHAAYTLMHFAGAPVVEVRGTFARFRQRIEGEDTASVQLLFGDGAIGEIFTSWAMPRPHGTHALHLMGEKGQLFGTGNSLYLLPEGFSEPARTELPASDSFEAQMACFHDCVRGRRRPPHSVQESREVLRLILEATASAVGWERHAFLKTETRRKAEQRSPALPG